MNKTAIITCASRGIGAAAALRLAAEVVAAGLCSDQSSYTACVFIEGK